jgi:hypothetical protein
MFVVHAGMEANKGMNLWLFVVKMGYGVCSLSAWLQLNMAYGSVDIHLMRPLV